MLEKTNFTSRMNCSEKALFRICIDVLGPCEEEDIDELSNDLS